MATPREAERLIVLRFCRVQPHCCSSGSIFSRASSSGDDIERAENSRNREKVEGRITKLGSALVSQPSRLEWLGLFFDWSFSGRRIQPAANDRSSRRKGVDYMFTTKGYAAHSAHELLKPFSFERREPTPTDVPD